MVKEASANEDHRISSLSAVVRLIVAAGAAQMGADVVLFEDGEMGGDCLNTGCIPSKALLAAARLHHVAGNAKMGIGQCRESGFAATKAHVADVIATIAPMILLTALRGLASASFVSAPALLAQRGNPQHQVTARYIVIATGSSPWCRRFRGWTGPFRITRQFFPIGKTGSSLIIGGGPTASRWPRHMPVSAAA